VVFDKSDGGIAQIVRDGVTMLAPGGGPKMYFYRAPHRIDDEWAERDWIANGIDSLQPRLVSFKAVQTGPSSVRVESVINADGRNGWSATHSTIYTVYGDGSIAVENGISPQGRRIVLARLGVRLQLDPRFDQFTYLGRGPQAGL
jgi:beta-galactosidase